MKFRKGKAATVNHHHHAQQAGTYSAIVGIANVNAMPYDYLMSLVQG
jgi:hypothetical protein